MSFCLYNKKNITRRLEDINFISSWQKQYLLTRCKILFCHSKKKFRSSRHRVISSISICLLLVNNFRELTTLCDEAEVHTKVHEGMLGKKPSPWQESISRPSNHLLTTLPTELWVTHIVSRTYSISRGHRSLIKAKLKTCIS